MSCPNFVIDEDGERICECGDEGRMCTTCAAREAAYWRDQWRIAPLSERDPERYRRELIETGRGHLVKP